MPKKPTEIPTVGPEELASVLTGPNPPAVVQMTIPLDTSSLDAAMAAHAAAVARGENVRDVVDALIASVATALAPAGFRYARSKRLITRKRGEWTDEVGFWVDSRNCVGIRIEFNVTARIRHKEFGKRRTQLGLRAEHARFRKDGFADVLAHQTVVPAVHATYYAVWDLANIEGREAVEQEVIERTQSILLPWFDRFADERILCERYACGKGLDGFFDDAGEFVFCLQGREALLEMVSAILLAHPEWASGVTRFLELGRSQGLRELSGFLEPEASLARLALKFELPVSQNVGSSPEASSKGQTMSAVLRHATPVVAIAASPSDNLIALSNRDGVIRIATATGETVREQQVDPAFQLVFTADGKKLLARGAEEVVTWAVPSLSELDRLQLAVGARGSFLSSDGDLLVSITHGKSTSYLSIRRVSDGEETHYEQLDGVGLGAAIAGEHLAISVMTPSAHPERAIEIRTLSDFDLVRRLVAPTGFMRPVLSPGARYVAAPGAGVVWDRESGDVVLELSQPRACICEFSRSGSFFATMCSDGMLRIWKLEGRQEIASIEIRRHIRFGGNPSTVAFSRDECTLFVGTEDGALLAWALPG